jgi:hypothetical protein
LCSILVFGPRRIFTRALAHLSSLGRILLWRFVRLARFHWILTRALAHLSSLRRILLWHFVRVARFRWILARALADLTALGGILFGSARFLAHQAPPS